MENPLIKGKREKIPLSHDRFMLSGADNMRLITSTQNRGQYEPMRVNFKSVSDKILSADTSCTIVDVFLEIEVNRINHNRCFETLYTYANEWCPNEVPVEVIAVNESAMVQPLGSSFYIGLNKRAELPVTNLKKFLMNKPNGNIVQDVIQKYFYTPVVYIGTTSMEDQEVMVTQSLHITLKEFTPYVYGQTAR
jgi:hypothetical protein